MAQRKKKKIGPVAAIVVAGGAGKRFGGQTPKQWSDLCGHPVVYYALQRLQRHPLIDEIVLVIDADHRGQARRLVKNELTKVSVITSGGKSRAASVRRGLRKISAQTEVIFIHDGVRPFFEDELIDRLLTALETYEAAVPVTLVGDTLKRLAGPTIESTVDRKGIALAKTPQAFRADVIRQAHLQAQKDRFEATDDSVLVERMGFTVGAVQTTYHNIKLTLRDDLAMARAILSGGQDGV